MVLEITLILNSKINTNTKFYVPIFKNYDFRRRIVLLRGLRGIGLIHSIDVQSRIQDHEID